MANSTVTPDDLDVIAKLIREETGKRQYYRPVYSIHKWWARRPGALFRSIILTANGNNLNLFSLNNGVIQSERSEYFKDQNLGDKIILDPFMGGGTTIAEANRMGAKVIGCDINPVSYWVVRETIKPLELQKLNDLFTQLEASVGSKIKDLYKTSCSLCGHAGDGMYVFWLRYIECPHCSAAVDLFKRTLLNEGRSRNAPISVRNPATVFCPICYALNEWSGKNQCECSSCGHIFDPRSGNYKNGYFVCRSCKKENISLIKTIKAGKPLLARMVAIEYWCPHCQARLHKSPDNNDKAKFLAARSDFEAQKNNLIFPRQKILKGASSLRWRQHNFEYYYQVFNNRQLLAFNILLEGINTIPDEEYRNSFITIFSNSLEYNNMMTPYNYPHRKLHHLFNYHALPLTTTPVENSVWGVSKEGAGTFVNCFSRYLRAKQYCQKPFDKFKDSTTKIRTVCSKQEKISANFVSSFEAVRNTSRAALLLCGDSANLAAIPNKSVDFIITDPPYFDNIHYSELSNFFYVWLAEIIDHPYFKEANVPTEKEAIVNHGMEKSESDYQKLLVSVFSEGNRVLKDEGKLIFTFHHKNLRAWWTILMSILESGFKVTDTFPINSEYKVNPHVRNKASLDMDLVIISGKKSAKFVEAESFFDDFKLNACAENESQNKAFLVFMGELFKQISWLWDVQKPTYKDFEQMVVRFQKILSESERKIVRETKAVAAKQLEFF